MRFSIRLYRWLIRLYPARFREEYGGPLEEAFREECTEAAGWAGMMLLWLRTIADLAFSMPAQILAELRQDARHSLRLYSRRPVVALFTVTALAIGIGVTTGVFTAINAVLLRSLPFNDPERLVLMEDFPSLAVARTPAFFRSWVEESAYLSEAAVYTPEWMNVAGGAEAVRARVAETTASFFTLFGAGVQLGRTFSAAEDIPGKNGVAVIGHSLWQHSFGGDPGVLGRTIRVNGVPFVVIGVTQPDFDFPDKTQVWISTIFDFAKIPRTDTASMFVAAGRLRKSITLQQAEAALHAEVKQHWPEMRGDPPHLIPLRRAIAGQVERAWFVLLGAVALVLLIACANVASVLLGRAAERRQELMIRAALGASRARLTQQMIIESLMAACIAGIAGLLVALWTVRLIESTHPAPLASQAYTLFDWQVLAFTAGISAVTGVLFGALPAIRARRLADGISRGSGPGSMPWHFLITAQIALTLMLLAGSIALLRSFRTLVKQDPGFQTENVLTLSVSLPGSRYHDGAWKTRQFYDELLRRLRAIPGVLSAGGVNYVPLGDESLGMWGYRVDHGDPVSTISYVASPGYFRTMGTPIVAGRDFGPQDTAKAVGVAVVNEEFARRAGGNAAVLGRNVVDQISGKEATIIGIARSIRHGGPGFEPFSEIYFPYEQAPWPYFTFVLKVAARPEAFGAAAREAVRSVDTQVPVFAVETLDQRLGQALARSRFYSTVVTFLGLFAAFLVTIGVYGVVSHAVARRTHEFGVRLAVGASAACLRAMMLRQVLVPVVVGAAAGVGGALALGRFVAALFYGAQPVDAGSCLMAAGALAVPAAAAVWSATDRLRRLDPVEVLRAE
jgi:putative ABC transport system permease protein